MLQKISRLAPRAPPENECYGQHRISECLSVEGVNVLVPRQLHLSPLPSQAQLNSSKFLRRHNTAA